MKIVRDSAVLVRTGAAAGRISPEEQVFDSPPQIALFFLWMLAFTLLCGTYVPRASSVKASIHKEKRDLPGANRKPVFLRRYGLRLRRFLTNGRIPDDFHRKCLLPYALMPPAWMPSSR